MIRFEKPTIVLIPGGWHSPTCFAPLRSSLLEHGYPSTAISLPSVDGRLPVSSHLDDVAVIRAELERLVIAEGKEVVLAMHSYGGIPGAGSVRGLEKRIREKKGEKGGIRAAVFMAAFLVPKGMSSMETGRAGSETSFMRVDPKDQRLMLVEKPEPFWYHDVPEVLRALIPREHPPMSISVFLSRAEDTCWESGYDGVQSWYLMCENDRALAVDLQERMVREAAKAGGRGWHVMKLKCGHSPWLARIPETVSLLRKAAGEELVEGEVFVIEP